MITPRTVILGVLAALLISLVWVVQGLLATPDSGGRAADSYGTRGHGQRALYDTMSELGLPVTRSLEPPGKLLPFDTTVVLWRPHGKLVAFEPRFLQELGDWVAASGRVVVTPPAGLNEFEELTVADLPIRDETTTLWDALHLGDRKLHLADVAVAAPQTPSISGPDASPSGFAWARPIPGTLAVDVEAHGALATLMQDVRQIGLPETGTNAIQVQSGETGDALVWADPAGTPRAAVRRFAVGEGEVVVVGDARLFSNRLLAQADNSVLAVRLLLGDRQRIVFNEFYHGLSVRGNALWLLTRPGYALLAIAVLGLVAVVTWRSAVLLGPPLTTPEPSRRTVAEYVDAMSRFLNRGRRTRARLLHEVYAGTLRRIAAEHGMTHSREDASAVAAVVARRDRQRSDRIRAAAAAVDAVLAKHDKATESQSVQALRQLHDCL